LLATRAPCVYLDVRHIGHFETRFPQVAELCAEFSIDVTRDRIPVRPSAHYMIGGVAVKLDGSTRIPGLLCCGEVACSGLHGANRIASNSLLEGLVFGRLAGETAGRAAAEASGVDPVHRIANKNLESTRTVLDLPDIRNSSRSVMWRNVGIVRVGDRLVETCDILEFWGHYTLDKTLDNALGWETQNELTVARLVTVSALERTESIGVHYRGDADEHAEPPRYHVTITHDQSGTKPRRMQAEQHAGSNPRSGDQQVD
jgi:L-aspartate oxidase